MKTTTAPTITSGINRFFSDRGIAAHAKAAGDLLCVRFDHDADGGPIRCALEAAGFSVEGIYTVPADLRRFGRYEMFARA